MKFLGLFLFIPFFTLAQGKPDPSYNKLRSWWDLVHYDLHIKVNIDEQSISGHNTMTYQALKGQIKQQMQIDLQEPMVMDSIIQNGKSIGFKVEEDKVFVVVNAESGLSTLTMYFHGKPPVSKQPPWESGMVWETDNDGNPFIASACQGAGPSIWWPCKDHPVDEVDSMNIHITCPKPLKAISNGKLYKVEYAGENSSTYSWTVKNPINSYGVNLSVGNYAYIKDSISGELGYLDADYYILPYNIEKAKIQFMDAHRTIEALEHWFGPYPFYEDGYKLVEVPYLGMEHQSCVTYGNGFQNGYRGYDLSRSGWGLKFDFIIVHESGHEWFANSITNANVADMWIHEGFTSYSENLFLDYHYGPEAGAAYTIGTRSNIQNDKPIIGNYKLGTEGSTDMYYKGANVIHTLATIHNNRESWRAILRKLNKTYFHKTVSSAEVENFLAKELGLNLNSFWDLYLRSTQIPTLTYRVDKKRLHYKYTNAIKKFSMPIRITVNGQEYSLDASVKKKRLKLKEAIQKVETNPNYYVNYQELE